MEHTLPISSHAIKPYPPVDYLVIGHATQDVQPTGDLRLGGTVTFSGLTALALGHSVGILTACALECDLSPLDVLATVRVDSDTTTTFRNIPSPEGRIQHLYHPATQLNASHLPKPWLKPAIVHLGPVAAEVDPLIYRAFSDSFICGFSRFFICRLPEMVFPSRVALKFFIERKYFSCAAKSGVANFPLKRMLLSAMLFSGLSI